MKHLATLGHPGDEQRGAIVLCEENGTVSEVLTGETLTRDEVQAAASQAKRYLEALEDYLERTTEGHPTLLRLKREFETGQVETGGGYDLDELSLELGTCMEDEALFVEAVYTHGDDPETEHHRDTTFIIKDGRFRTERWSKPDADANDYEACQKLLAKALCFDCPA